MCGKQSGTTFEGPFEIGHQWLTRAFGVVTHIPKRQVEFGLERTIQK